MQITQHLLSIPPYLATTWKNILSLKSKKEEEGIYTLFVVLQDGTTVEVPHLEEKKLLQIFEAHARFLSGNLPKEMFDSPFSFRLPGKTEEGGLGVLGTSFQHNPEQIDAPLLPSSMLKKMVTILKVFQLDTRELFTEAQEDCRCLYCQIGHFLKEEREEGESVTEEDLHFRDWQIEEIEHQLYRVTHPIESAEQYTVYLGSPLGCTCGQSNCEHIRAVLQS